MTETPRPRLTFLQLLETLEQANQGMIDVDMEQLAELLATKTDAISMTLKEMEEREKYLRSQAQELTNAAREIKRANEALRSRVMQICTSKGEPIVLGDVYKIAVTKNGQPSLKITEEKPQPEYLTKYQGCVRLELVWDTDGVKEHLHEVGELPFAKLEYGEHLRITVNKASKPKKKALPSGK